MSQSVLFHPLLDPAQQSQHALSESETYSWPWSGSDGSTSDADGDHSSQPHTRAGCFTRFLRRAVVTTIASLTSGWASRTPVSPPSPHIHPSSQQQGCARPIYRNLVSENDFESFPDIEAESEWPSFRGSSETPSDGSPRQMSFRDHAHTQFNLMRQRVRPRFPTFTAFITVLVWAFFLYGVGHDIGWDKAHLSSTSPLSPPQRSYWFVTAQPWPSCEDVRAEGWRLVSYQFVHEGLTHISTNTFMGFVYGAVLEASHDHAWIAFVTFEMGVMMGAMGWSHVWPFRGLVGCSAGVYAIVGGLIAHLIISAPSIQQWVWWGGVLLMGCQMLFDAIGFFAWYNEDTAYVAHMCGWVAGLLVGLMCGWTKKRAWQHRVAMCALIAMVGFTTVLVCDYATTWPPEVPTVNWSMHENYHPGSCCVDLYHLVAAGASADEVRSSYQCTRENKLVPK